MINLDDLTHAYLAAHPLDAARELERLPALSVAQLLGAIPVRLSAPVLGAMLPGAAARCLAPLAIERLGLVLGALSAPAAAGVLRHFDDVRRARALEQLPTGLALACQTLLRYPDDALGAVVDTDVVALPAAAAAGDALQAVARLQQGHPPDVYVLGAEQQLLGVVPVAQLLTANEGVTLQTLLKSVVTLPALMPLQAAADSPAWSEANVVPIVERGGRFLGVLSASTLRRRLLTQPAASPADGAGLPTAAFNAYWLAVSSLTEAVVAAVAAPTRTP